MRRKRAQERTMMTYRLIQTAALCVLSLAPAATQAQTIVLAPHRAVYDLSFVRSQQSRGVDAARGRIVFEINGSVCEGYAANFRQVVQMDSSESGPRLMDVRSTTFENGDGKGYRFQIDRTINRGQQATTEGRTQTRDGEFGVQLSKPKADRVRLPQDVMFPTIHTRALIEAAVAGKTTLNARTYDGSDEGQAVYETFAVIGAPVQRKDGETIEDAAKSPALAATKSWPVTISYYKAGVGDQTPAYVMAMELYENGVSRNLRLDYGSLVLKGDMTQLEMGKPAAPCN
jgi:hypothetical protein